MKKIILVIMSSFFLVTSAFADGHSKHDSMLVAEKIWARASIGNAKNGAAYAILKNKSEKEITIISGSSAASARVELHNHIHENGVMKMRQVKSGIKIPAGGMTELKPGGLHIMLMGLKKPLKAGDAFNISLTTAAGDLYELKVHVKDGIRHKGSNKGSYKGSHSGN